MERFGRILKELRISRNLTQKEVSKILNIDYSNISRWEKGQFEPDQNTLIRIADYFEVSLDYLMGRKDY